jgi:hypothetical protein
LRWIRWWGCVFTNTSLGKGLGDKNMELSVAAQILVCSIKQQWRAMGGGSGEVGIKW